MDSNARSSRSPLAMLALALFAGALVSCADGGGDPTRPAKKTTTLSVAEREVLGIARELPREVRAGQEIEYRIRVQNVLDEPVTGVVLRERLPRDFEVLDAYIRWDTGDAEDPAEPREGERGRGGPVEAAAAREQGGVEQEDGELVFRIGRLEPDQELVILVSGVAHGEGEAESHTTVSYDAVLPMAWNVVDPELTFELAFEQQAATICDDLSLVYRLSNPGTGTIESGQLRIRLPEGLRTQEGAAEVELEFDALRGGRTHEERIELRADRAGEFRTEAVAVNAQGEVRARPQVLRVFEPRLEMQVGPIRQLPADATREVEVMLANTGEVPIQDLELRVESAEGAGAELAEPGERRTGELELGRLDPGARRQLTLVLSPGEAETRFEVVLVATARCMEDERATRERLAGSIVGVAALRVRLVDETDPVPVGQTTTYRVEVENQGSSADRAIEVAMRLPPELEFVDGAGASAVAGDGEQVRFAQVDALEPGDTAEWRVRVRARAPGRTVTAVQVRSEASPEPVLVEEPTTVVE